jgi:hypothetical protein
MLFEPCIQNDGERSLLVRITEASLINWQLLCLFFNYVISISRVP